MATLGCGARSPWPPSRRANPAIKAFFERLAKTGKAPKAALTACIRKLLVIANPVIRDNKPWQPAHA